MSGDETAAQPELGAKLAKIAIVCLKEVDFLGET